MSPRGRVEHLVSAGGVVYRIANGQAEVVVCGRNDPQIWGLPKGTPNPGEDTEETAIREVQEETGLEVELESFIDSISYWFVRSTNGEKVRYHKTVHFYLMSCKGGAVYNHDPEFDVVQWLPGPEALEVLTYENEARVVEKALSMALGKTRIP